MIKSACLCYFAVILRPIKLRSACNIVSVEPFKNIITETALKGSGLNKSVILFQLQILNICSIDIHKIAPFKFPDNVSVTVFSFNVNLVLFPDCKIIFSGGNNCQNKPRLGMHIHRLNSMREHVFAVKKNICLDSSILLSVVVYT